MFSSPENAPKNFFKQESLLKARVLMSLWLMDSTMPSTVPDNPFFPAFVSMLNYNFKPKSNNTELRYEKAIFGFCFLELKRRLKNSYQYFNEPFLILESDAWTAENNVSVFGISCTFYDLVLKKAVTVLLASEPIVKGKTAEDLKLLIKGCLSKFNIEMSWVKKCVADEEGAVQNCLKELFNEVDVCMAHKLQTLIRHAFGLSKKMFKKNPFKKGFYFFQKIKSLVAYFSKSPKRTRLLKKIQKEYLELSNKKFNQSNLVGVLKFSGTRWSGAFMALSRLFRLKDHF